MYRMFFAFALYLVACADAQEVVSITLTDEEASRFPGGYDPSVLPHCTIEIPIRTPDGFVCYEGESGAQQPFEGPFTFYQRALEGTSAEDLVGRDGSDWSDRLDSTIGFSREYVALCRTEILNNCDLVDMVYPDWERFSSNSLISALIAEEKGFPSEPETFVRPISSREEFERRVKEFVEEYRRQLRADAEDVD